MSSCRVCGHMSSNIPDPPGSSKLQAYKKIIHSSVKDSLASTLNCGHWNCVWILCLSLVRWPVLPDLSPKLWKGYITRFIYLLFCFLLTSPHLWHFSCSVITVFARAVCTCPEQGMRQHAKRRWRQSRALCCCLVPQYYERVCRPNRIWVFFC